MVSVGYLEAVHLCPWEEEGPRDLVDTVSVHRQCWHLPLLQPLCLCPEASLPERREKQTTISKAFKMETNVNLEELST